MLFRFKITFCMPSGNLVEHTIACAEIQEATRYAREFVAWSSITVEQIV